MRLRLLLLALSCATLAHAQIQTSDTTLMLRYPDVHGDQLVFMYAADLWSVSASGGDAHRLTSHEGYESLPRISPDGTTIAFTAEYEGGGGDVYTIPASGGEPKRLTWHPLLDRVTGWTPDGRIVFRSKRSSVVRNFDKLFTIAPGGGVPVEVPLPSGGMNAFSPDGTKIAYNPVATESFFWKRYRGGTQSHIAMYDFRTHAYEEIPHGDAGELFPMWFRDAVFFLSDRDGVMNLYRYDLASRAIRQLTHYRDYDIKWPSLASDGSGRIAYENGGAIYLFDIAKETSARVPIRVRTDAPRERVTTINAKKWLQTVALSPSGARALLGARGEVFTVPAKEGEIRDLTNSSGARELWPAWSPDGRWIAYASDRNGEYEIYLRAQDGSGDERRLTNLGAGFRSNLTWSPDAKKIAFAQLDHSFAFVDVDSGKVTTVDRSDADQIAGFSWSPDSKWLVYAKPLLTNFGQLFAYSLADAKSTVITDGLTDDRQPRIDPTGTYLFFLSRRVFAPHFSDFEKTFDFSDSQKVYLIPLRRDTPSPFAPKSDEEGAATETKPAAVPFRIDFASIDHRVLPLPIDAGAYSSLAAADGAVFYLAGDDDDKKTLKSFELADAEEKTIVANIDSYALDAHGDKLVYRAGDTVGILDAAKSNAKIGDGALDLAHLEMQLDRRAEWKQIFDEAWRMLRDGFYDPTMRGVDWNAMKRRYEAELPFVSLRNDVNILIGEMNGELGISHINASGGDTVDTPAATTGLLGADYDVAGDLYRIRKIYRGDNASDATRSPLDAPGIDVREGDYLLAIDGRPLRAPMSIFAALDRTAGRQVALLVNDKPNENGARRVVVVPVKSEEQLRYRDWVETNRRKVDAATNGRCAYIHIPDTHLRGIAEFGRQFYAQAGKQCLLFDARWNNGGEIPDFYFEHLARRHLEYDAPRYGADVEYQAAAILGPKVLVINEYAGSGGDSVADYFRKYALGPIVGKRTWGGLMGIGDELPMIDGGRVTVPFVSAWDVVDGKSTWIVENHGVDPDVEVDNRPDLVAAGRDPQLERGIAILNDELAKHPPVRPQRPPYGAPPAQ
ncbi:MAG: PD40 domain-containing protein [Acidobacteria bacterium]|nr:PD40 domain-containing protein [Acidobacteriota bacterium]MBV9478502.1 PD40 domain-containing protein [Acidobacteriota bacterium]